MGKVLIIYYSLMGSTEVMADYIAEGVRFSGHDAIVKEVTGINKNDLEGYDGYIFGSPTHHRDIAEPLKEFLFLPDKDEMKDKLAGAFGSYTHTDEAPSIIFDTMKDVFKMKMFELGPFHLEEKLIQTQGGMKACHDYGRVFGEDITS